MRTMLDSTTAADIPADTPIVAGYVDGKYRWTDAAWALFPDAVKVRIAVFASTDDGVVLDVENGDATPEQAPGWVSMRRAAGVDPTVYCSLSAWPDVRAEFAKQGVAEPHWWIAAYPGNGAALYDGAVAHQWADQGPNGEHYDMSAVADYWPGVDAAPTSPTVTVATGPTTGDKVTPINAHVPALDDQGNGYIDLAAMPASRVVSVIANAEDPATNGYHAPPTFDCLDLGGTARVVIHGGIPHGSLDLTVWTV